MTRRVGVLVALVALMATASADKAKKTGKAAPAPAPTEAPAEQPAADPAEDAPKTREEIEAGMPPHQTGPKHVVLDHGVEIDLPDGIILFEHTEAKKMLEEGGDRADNVSAMILDLNADWLVLVEYDDVGYVTDKDADELDANELFNSYKQGTDQDNINRRAKGVPELILDGWSEKPKYDKASHHLVWGLNAHSTQGPVINYFRRILGRNGYMSVNLIDAADKIEASKQATAQLVQGIRFAKGQTYEDHVESDRSSGMGLRALVIGGTGLAVMKVAKAGILIKLLLIFKKAFIFLAAAIGGFFKWLFGKKKTEDVAFDPPPPTDGQG
jgi:uncharacterized membrane-anchored protein